MSANQARIAAALIEAGAGRDQEGWGTAAKERRTGRGQGPGPVGRWQGPVFTTPVLNEMIASGFPDRAWALIEAGGVGVNAQNLSNGKTPLMLAIEGGHRDLAIKLCRLEDLDTSAENNAGSTALQMARGEGFDDVAAAIVRAKQWKSMRQAEQQQQPAVGDLHGMMQMFQRLIGDRSVNRPTRQSALSRPHASSQRVDRKTHPENYCTCLSVSSE